MALQLGGRCTDGGGALVMEEDDLHIGGAKDGGQVMQEEDDLHDERAEPRKTNEGVALIPYHVTGGGFRGT
jgi:hypothetical protein